MNNKKSNSSTSHSMSGKPTITIIENSIGKAIFFTIATLGIYAVYWQYLLMKNIRAITKSKKSCVGEMLCYFIIPFYALYWWYKNGTLVREEFSKHNLDASSNGIKCMLFSLLLWIIPAAIMQSDFNSLPVSRQENVSLKNPRIKLFDKLVFRTEKHTYEIYGVKNAEAVKAAIEEKVQIAKKQQANNEKIAQ